jgi:alkylated DNA repair dioxygenase AlkB
LISQLRSCGQIAKAESPLAACPELELLRGFYGPADSRRLYRELRAQDWPDNHYQVAGRQFTLPRQQTWHADEGIVYSYSNNLLQTRPWATLLTELRRDIIAALGHPFNAVLVNLYRNGDDYVGWHADDEIEMGDNPLIASLSLGAERLFSLRHKQSGATYQLPLPSGSLLVMRPPLQQYWEHAVLPAPGLGEGRINLTFRQVAAPPTQGN